MISLDFLDILLLAIIWAITLIFMAIAIALIEYEGRKEMMAIYDKRIDEFREVARQIAENFIQEGKDE